MPSDEVKSMIGLEIHVPLKTERKLFCDCPTNYWADVEPNTNTCPVCTGMPGSKPYPINEEALKTVVMIARLLDGTTDYTPVLAVDNTSYYEDIRKQYQEHAWPKLPLNEREGAVNILLANLVELEAEDTFDREAYERVLGPEKLKLENALKRGFEDIIDDGIADPNF